MAELIACAGQGVELSGVPTEIKILPLGRVHSQKGDFTVDDESFELIRKQFKDRKLDLVIDYEHQTLSDVQAPAGGWIKDLYKGEDAIIAKVEWTAKAAEYLKNKEYRYLSPVVLVRKRDQKAAAIHSVALTNTPAIDGMFALVNSLDIEDISEGGNIMDLKELAKALGLPETATEEEIKKAVEDAAKAAEKLKEMDGKKPGEGEGKPGDGDLHQSLSTTDFPSHSSYTHRMKNSTCKKLKPFMWKDTISLYPKTNGIMLVYLRKLFLI